MRDLSQKSMFTHIQCILDQYGLPSIFELLRNTPSKPVWKRTLNHKIHEKVESFWETDIKTNLPQSI